MLHTATSLLAVSAALLTPVLSSPHASAQSDIDPNLAALVKRAFAANAPHGYTPQTIACPSTIPSIRSASSLSASEQQWLQRRRKATLQPMRTLLARLNITGLDTNQYIDRLQNNASALPNIAIAASGGGYRAMMTGAGVVQAFDSRTPGATGPGQVGGILQAATYLSGLSGGSWLVGSLYANNFTSVDEILAADESRSDSSSSGNLWQLQHSILEGPDRSGPQLDDTVDYYVSLTEQVHGKEKAGFNVTVTDYWSRALSYQLINAPQGGPAYTFSSIAQQDWFTSGDVPLPLLVADSRAPGVQIVSTNSTVFSFSPWELGSDDPTLYAFAPLQYVGTDFTDGRPRSRDRCVVGFDNAGYVMGTSSSLFNAILTTLDQTNSTGRLSAALVDSLQAILRRISAKEEDIADWVNPFYHYRNDSTAPLTQDDTLTLVDGGMDGQNIPLHPLIQPNRQVDVVFAIDSSADTDRSKGLPTADSANGWPSGVSLITTYQRSLSDIGNGTAFPAVPGLDSFFNLGLNNRPSFFGCHASNLTGPSPLIVYLPNAPYVYQSNFSTFKMEYSHSERNAVALNGYNLATQGNGTLDREWPACVGCAILSRSLDRTETEVPDICTRCFQRYCWDGTVNTSSPADYLPAYKLDDRIVRTTSRASHSWPSAFHLLSAIAVPMLTRLM